MQLHLRTVIYSGKVEIDNVPVYSCDCCHRSEVYHVVKGDLASLIEQFTDHIDEDQRVRFDEHNELAWLLVKAANKDTWHEPISEIIEERINELLDLMLLAKSLHNAEWLEETRSRLRQLTDYHVIAQTTGRAY